MRQLDVMEMSISEMSVSLDHGEISSVDLVCAYLNRIAFYDRTGICLNSVPILNPWAIEEAEESDRRRRIEDPRGPLEGVPFTVKDSYMVKGLTVAAGSPALRNLVASRDAASVELLRAAGAVLIGKTNMPPMAAGGTQPGEYGYAKSPYNPAYLSAAYGSGSSNGSGVAVSASFCAFGMAEETLSSGRSPASNNSLVAYTPSRGMISTQGNWPLRPTCDVVVPHTRSVEDLLLLLDILIAEDSESLGDFWRQQSVVEIPSPRTASPPSCAQPRETLTGVKLGVPRRFVGASTQVSGSPVIRETVEELWARAAQDFRDLGAEITYVDPPVFSNYEEDREGDEGVVTRGLIEESWLRTEEEVLAPMALDQFLRINNDSELSSWADVDGDNVFPEAPERLHIEKAETSLDWQSFAEYVKDGLPASYDDVPGAAKSLLGMERARTVDLDDWLNKEGLHALVFPTNGDVGQEGLLDSSERMEAAMRNGVVYSNGNWTIRHLGIPTVTVPMGIMIDTKMPVGITFAGAAYSDQQLLDIAYAYERRTRRRKPPHRAPSLPSNRIAVPHPVASTEFINDDQLKMYVSATVKQVQNGWLVEVYGTLYDSQQKEVDYSDVNVECWADGQIVRSSSPRTFAEQVSRHRSRLDAGIRLVVKAYHRSSGRTLAHTQVLSLE